MIDKLDATLILQQIWENSSDTFWICKPVDEDDFEVLDFNPAEIKYIDNSKEKIRLKKILKNANESLQNYYKCQKEGMTIRFEQNPIINGEEHLFDTLLIPIKNKTGEVVQIVGTSRDITQKRKTETKLLELNKFLGQKVSNAEATIATLLHNLEDGVKSNIKEKSQLKKISETQREIASKDHLLNIYNRRKFDELFDIEISRAKQKESDLTLLLLDIDHFKKINDSYGHLIGDEVLKELVSLILKNIRKSDIFTRWGGEEFVILCADTNEDETMQLAQKIRSTIENHSFKNIKSLTISIGVSSYTLGCNKTFMLQNADIALYEAKQKGRNRVVSHKLEK